MTTRTYTAAGVGLAASSIVVWALDAYTGVSVPVYIASAFGYVCAFTALRIFKGR